MFLLSDIKIKQSLGFGFGFPFWNRQFYDLYGSYMALDLIIHIPLQNANLVKTKAVWNYFMFNFRLHRKS